MKKSIIATGAAAVALAAMPVLGAFADVTDTVTVTINSSCSMGGTTATSGDGKNFSETMTNGSLKTWDATDSAGGKLVVSCNDASGWNISAVGTGADTTNKNYMNAAASGTDIATGTATSGDVSNWAMKVSGAHVVNNYDSFHAVPAASQKVASNNASASSETYYTGYQVWISATQEADIYQGKVTYTVAQGV